MKQKQHRPATRAPNGAPEYTERISFYATERQKKAFRKLGGSGWARAALDQAIARSK